MVKRDEKTKKTLGLVQTGGTIASVKGPQGTDLSLEDAIAGLLGKEVEDYNIITSQPYKILSENANTLNWQMAAQAISDLINRDVDGIVVTHGTDTMTYAAAALSYMLRSLPIPVILTGSMLSSDDVETDGRPNLAWSIRAAMHPNAPHEVMVMFGGGLTAITAYYVGTDNFVDLYHADRLDELLIRGSRVRKVSAWPDYFKPAEKRYAAFQSIHSDILGAVADGNLIFNSNVVPNPATIDTKISPFEAHTDVDPMVIPLRVYPGFDPNLIVKLVDLGYHGIILEGYGDGTLPSGDDYSLLPSIKTATSRGAYVCVTSSVLGPATTGVYAGSRNLADVGAIPLHDMVTEGATVKLMWVLANYPQQVAEMMQTNLAGEIQIGNNT